MRAENDAYYVSWLRRLGIAVREQVRENLTSQGPDALSKVAREAPDDTIYRLDEAVEQVLMNFCREWARERAFVLIAEGLEAGRRVFPTEARENEAAFTLIVDPVDGTRSLMYDKRSAWSLCAVAPTPEGRQTDSLDIRVAVQTEIPTSRQYLAAQVWATASSGARAEMHDLVTGEVRGFALRPSQSSALEDGFAGFVKFFLRGKARIAAVEADLFRQMLPEHSLDRVFDDQYISTGGQLYELMTGRDRFVADIRPLLLDVEGGIGLCPHPYDLCTELIAREAGVHITGLDGQLLRFPLDTTTPVGWAGYANQSLRSLIEPHLLRVLAQL